MVTNKRKKTGDIKRSLEKENTGDVNWLVGKETIDDEGDKN